MTHELIGYFKFMRNRLEDTYFILIVDGTAYAFEEMARDVSQYYFAPLELYGTITYCIVPKDQDVAQVAHNLDCWLIEYSEPKPKYLTAMQNYGDHRKGLRPGKTTLAGVACYDDKGKFIKFIPYSPK